MSERFKMDTDKIQIDTNKEGDWVYKTVDKVYHIKELHKIIEDVIKQYINDVVLMSDEELRQDRSEWIKTDAGSYDDDGTLEEMKYATDIQTIAIELEQLRRYKEITYIDKLLIRPLVKE
jgi:hypothetical protein